MNKQDNISREKKDKKLENFAKRKQNKKKILKYISIPAVIIAIIVFAVVCFVFFFKIKSIEINGANIYNSETLKLKCGIEIGENLYSFDEDDVKERLTLNFPYIKDVKIERQWPDTIVVNIIEEKQKYVTEAYGETLILSESLRVLENPDVRAKDYDLCYLILPDIERALVGNKPVFIQNADYIQKVLKSIEESSFAKNITAISFKNKFSISFLMGNTYKVTLGDTSDLSIKLNMTDKIIESGKIPTGQKAALNVSNPVECTAIIGESAVIELE